MMKTGELREFSSPVLFADQRKIFRKMRKM